MNDDSFSDVMARLQERDDAAASAVFERFARRLVALAASRLDGPIRRKVGPEDVVQSVFRSFFVHYREGEFDFGNWDALWAFLVLVTVRKCGRAAEFFRARRRDLGRELPLHGGDESRAEPRDAVDEAPTPLEAAALAESVEELLGSLAEDEREVIVLRLQNYTVPEISQRIQRTERTVHRILARARTRLESRCTG